MRKSVQFAILLLFGCLAVVNGQKGKTTAEIKFEMFSDEIDTTLGRTYITHAFTDGKQGIEMDLFDGMMWSRIVSYEEQPEKSRMYLSGYGMNYEITDLSEEYLESGINVGNLTNAEEVTYNKKDKKKILGYKCYKASLKLNTGQVNEYYITEKIQHPSGTGESGEIQLKGYPLELKMVDEEGAESRLKAIEVHEEIESDIFGEVDGYEQMTYEEFESMQ